jgi:hypothetical protein
MLMKKNMMAALSAVATLLSAVGAATNNTINSQIRLAYAGDNGMYVSWNTFEQLSNPTVHYGLSPHALNKHASSNLSVTYPTSLTYNNHVKLTGLKPDTTYYYLPEHLLHEDATAYSFTTSRPAGDGTPYSIAVVVDLGTMGPQGLTTYAASTTSKNNILKPGEMNTIDSLTKVIDTFDFVWHRKVNYLSFIGTFKLTLFSW